MGLTDESPPHTYINECHHFSSVGPLENSVALELCVCVCVQAHCWKRDSHHCLPSQRENKWLFACSINCEVCVQSHQEPLVCFGCRKAWLFFQTFPHINHCYVAPLPSLSHFSDNWSKRESWVQASVWGERQHNPFKTQHLDHPFKSICVRKRKKVYHICSIL